MPVPVSACLIIDTSASMTGSGYVTNTVIDSKAFVSYGLAGDALGVVNYDVNANNCYAPNGQMAVVDASLSQVAAASAAISGLTFNGSCTNIGSGIQAAYTLLAASSIAPRAAVLLTDGYQNCGTSPLDVPPTYPVYACAMGPNSDTGLLQKVATRTNGVYYYMPYPVNMMQIFNQIRASQPRIQSVVNYLSTLNASQQSLLLPATVSSTSEMHQVGLVWSDPSYVYSNNPAPTGNQLYVTLYQPNGQLSAAAPAATGAGYVVFDIPTPQAGTWYVYAQYAGGANALAITAGVFELTPASVTEIHLAVDAPASITAGEPLRVRARLLEGDEPVDVHSITAECVAPVLSVKNALARYAAEIAAVTLPAGDADEHDTPERRLALLHGLHLPTRDLLPHRAFGAPMAADGDAHGLVVPDTLQAGSYNIVVRAHGRSRRSQSPVQRTRLVTVVVNDA